MQEEFDDRYYSDLIIKSLRTILNCIGNIHEDTINYDCMLDLSERVNKQLRNIADPE